MDRDDDIAHGSDAAEHLIGDFELKFVLKGEHQRNHAERIEAQTLERRFRDDLGWVNLVVLAGDNLDHTRRKTTVDDVDGFKVAQRKRPRKPFET